MFVRFALSVAMALGLAASVAAGAAQACECRVVHPVVHRVIHHPAPRPVHRGCDCYRPTSFHHVRHRHVRVIERVRVARREDWSQGLAYGYAEADEHRRLGLTENGLRPSPPHPWATNRYGYLTWSGKVAPDAGSEGYGGYTYDRYGGGAADDGAYCQTGCGPAQPPRPY